MKARINLKFTNCILLFLLFLLFSPVDAAVFVTGDGERHDLQTIRINDLEYVSVNDLASSLNAEAYWHRLLRKVTLEFGEHQIVLTWFSPYLLYDSEVYNLTYEVIPKDGTLYVPLKGFQRIYDYIHSYPTHQHPPLLRDHRFNILDLNVEEKVNGILIEIFLTNPLEYEMFADQNQTLNINFYQGSLDTTFFNRKEVPEILNWIKACQFETSAQLSLKLKEPFFNFTQRLKSDPDRIQISLIPMPSSRNTSELTFGNIPDESERKADDLIDVIVIDPGHGGLDSGAVGRDGLLEKDVTLDIARRLKDILQKERELKIIMTRETDTLVPLEERTQIANRNGADLFISIHTNSFAKRSARGSETFFLSSAKNDDARSAAALENSSLRFEFTSGQSQNVNDLDFILMDLVQSEYLKESSDLAGIIQQRLKTRLSIPSRGVSQAGFVVLNKAYMPAVLVETAFISNKKDEGLLKKDSFRQDIAGALFESITDFKKKYESTK